MPKGTSMYDLVLLFEKTGLEPKQLWEMLRKTPSFQHLTLRRLQRAYQQYQIAKATVEVAMKEIAKYR
ncbi:MAG: hypothetical protein J7K83_00625 [Candidatus Aenigmarchaeota archaeon]|nr:hypothetical protein [Candidatus Aenigmarchaeota archaeon]